jgi:hypothetical protein
MSNAHGEFPITPTESKTTCTVGNFPRGSRETPETSVSQEADRSEKARCRKSDVHVSGESDSSIVPEKQANKGSLLPAESVEGRGLTEENISQLLLDRTQRRAPRSRGLLGVRDAVPRALPRDAARSSSSEVRAVCGSSARTDLREGQPARAVPIAITFGGRPRVRSWVRGRLPSRNRFLTPFPGLFSGPSTPSGSTIEARDDPGGGGGNGGQKFDGVHAYWNGKRVDRRDTFWMRTTNGASFHKPCDRRR